jgi:dTMP kinase
VADSTGLLITFEGGEGSGKSTQARLLRDYLLSEGREVVLTQEPRGTEFGVAVWELLARGVDPLSELFLFAANRAHHVRTLIKPALDAGNIVICDRFSDSTIAYQEFGRGLDGDLVRRACRYAEGGVTPDLTFLLDIDPMVGLRRKDEATEEDAIGRESLEFHRKVRAGYLALAHESPERIRLHDAAQDKKSLAEAIRAGLLAHSARK